MNPAIFREYDIRGVAERDFDAAFAHSLGRAYAASLAAQQVAPRHGRLRIGVGRDCRLTSDAYADALRAGLLESGLDVVDLGVCPTPVVYFSLFELDLDGALQVTGSHNPAEDNGFKICVGRSTIHGPAIQALRRLLEAGTAPRGAGRLTAVDIVSRYIAHLTRRFGRLARPLHVVVDAGNATAGPVAPPILRALGCRVDELYCDMDGRFPHHHPDPTVEENLRDLIARVRAVGADAGLAFDGDADRLGVVDRHGRVIWGDELLVVFARDLLERHPGATIVSEVKCSQRLYDDITARGGRAIMWKAGHSPIKAKMRETGALLAGEMSGHLFFAEGYHGYDDAVYAACALLDIMARTGQGVDALLADLPTAYATPEIRVDCPDAIKFAVVDAAQRHFRASHEVIDVDGVRVRLPHGWGLIRASNTQPALVLRCEADSPAALAEYRASFTALVETLRGQVAGAA
ncbi:MAG: phosphomannomutase/phosphoglucomutase [Candidatus Binatia bacterium]